MADRKASPLWEGKIVRGAQPALDKIAAGLRTAFENA